MSKTANGTADTDKPMEESAERLARPLIKLAKACGVATFYIDQQGSYTEITDEALVGVLDSLGMPADTQDNIASSYKRVQAKRASELLPPTVVSFNGTKTCVPIHAGDAKPEDIRLSLTLEDGTDYEGKLGSILTEDDGDLYTELPDDLPMGSGRGMRHGVSSILPVVRWQPVADRICSRDGTGTPPRYDLRPYLWIGADTMYRTQCLRCHASTRL